MSSLTDQTPNIEQLEALLRAIQPNPGARFRRRMALAPWVMIRAQSKGGFHMNRKFSFAALVAVLIVAIFLAFTPAGRVLADEILHFFNRTPGNSVPLPPDQIFTPMPTRTPEPTRTMALQPAESIAETSTPTPRPTLALRLEEYQDMTAAEAEAAAGFELYEPLRLPRDYRLTRILYNAETQSVTLQYASPQAGAGEFFQVTQGQHLAPLSVGADAQVETVPVGPYSAEFVRGGWFTADGAAQSTWENEAGLYTLRWQAADAAVLIQFFMNESFSPAYLERDEMLAVAQSLMRCPTGEASTCEISQAAAAAGFTPWQFAALPEGFSFKQADYRPNLTSLWYGKGAEQLNLAQSNQDFASRDKDAWTGVPADAVRTVTIAGSPAEYVKGSFIVQAGAAEATWNPDAPVERLRWKNGGFWFELFRTGSRASEGAQVDADQLTALAGQVSGSAVPSKTEAPAKSSPESSPTGTFSSIAEVEAKAGFDVLEPGVLPEGLAFSHARYDSTFSSVMSFYGSFAPDKMHANGPVLLVSQAQSVAPGFDPARDFPPEAVQAVEVNGRPAVLIAGLLETSMPEPGQPTPTPAWRSDNGVWILIWDDGSRTFSVHFDPAGRGLRLTVQEMIQIAESLR